MKTILGLDLGTNSIGWALVKHNFEKREGEILGMGSRIIPMSQDILGKFDSGQSISQTAERTGYRGTRRLFERDVLRRERLHRVLNILDFLPNHYVESIDFEQRLGQFKENTEPKIAYRVNAQGKNEFIFQKSFDEMVEDFKKTQPQLFYQKPNGEESKIPYDWTIYYLRKKALTQQIGKEELAWILLNFNQKRGYYQLRGEEDEQEDKTKSVNFYALKVIRVEETEKGRNEDVWYNVHLENGWIYRRSSKTFLDWEGKIKEFIVTEDLNEDGSIKTDRAGKEKRSFKAVDSEQDWIAIKKSTEEKIEKSNQTVGTYIYETLLQKPNQKVRGKLIRTIERKYYKDELNKILEKQKEFHSELKDTNSYIKCIEELYPFNDAHRNNISNRDFTYLFIDDIIFYQRPLKQKKHLINNCSLEYRSYKNEDDIKVKVGVKCIAKSNPIYQEFRLVQWLKNLKLFKKDDRQDIEITNELLPKVEDWEKLYTWLNDKVEIDQETILKYPEFNLEEKIRKEIGSEAFKLFKKNKELGISAYYRWNYVEDKIYPLNETRGQILKVLNRAKLSTDFLNNVTETHLWHILYSVEDKKEIELALTKYASIYDIPSEFIDAFKRFPRIDKEYGAFSEKAIKKLLQLMRFGKWWDETAIDKNTKERIEKIITGEFDEKIKNSVREKALHLESIQDFQNLPLWLASYIIYNRHSESEDTKYWKNANDIELLKQHSLRNPIVEQIINETLQTIREIWLHYGDGEEGYFDEIHVELGREMKNPADKRKRMTDIVTENENTNNRIKSLLMEFFQDSEIQDVRPHSPMQQEILKIYEEGVYYSETRKDELDEIDKIRSKSKLTASDIKRYKLWLEQGYISPYTGKTIPLARLFTTDYQIEHIIPQSRFFDDSLSNKVICESEVNSLKDNQLALEFIKNNKELKIELGQGRYVNLLNPDAYVENVKKYFAGNRLKAKREKLLLEEIPEKFIQRQINDTRYISKVVKTLLSNIVREDGEEESVAKNIVVSSGAITSRLKQDWGLNNVWNDLIAPRFERLNQMAGYEKYGSWENKEGKRVFQISNTEQELSKLNKKRIDHRHHALDALIVACSSRSHINYLNNDNANGKDKDKPLRYDLRNKLRRIEKYTKDGKERTVAKEFVKPWETFTQDAKNKLQQIIVSFKQNNRVINKTVNHYQKWVKQEDGTMKKIFVKQTKGDNWAIRKSLHTPMPYGKKIYGFNLLKVSENVGKRNLIIDKDIREKVEKMFRLHNGKITETQNYLKKNPINDNNGKPIISTIFRINTEKYRKRQPIHQLSNRGQGGIKSIEDAIKFINKVADTKIQGDLLEHLEKNGNDLEKAFNSEGIDNFNAKRKTPVYKLPIAESGSGRFAVGYNIGTRHKWVEADKGTNLFFAIYQDKDDKRSYNTIPLNGVIERQKQGLNAVPEINDKGHELLFHLSPDDLIYAPTEEELENPSSIDFNNLTKEQTKRIYFVNDFSGSTCYFRPNRIAKAIVEKEVDMSHDKKKNKITGSFDIKTASLEGKQIKDICIKIKVDRLGNISKA